MTVIHANDPTTKVLSLLYEGRDDVSARMTEANTKGAIRRALRSDDTIMMLGHGNNYGLFSTPSRKGKYERLLIDGSFVEFLRNKTCIGIWCYANEFAVKYGLRGLFSGMIVSELQEAVENKISATKEEIDVEIEKFARRLRECIEMVGLKETPMRMRSLDDVGSELTAFNYANLFYYE